MLCSVHQREVDKSMKVATAAFLLLLSLVATAQQKEDKPVYPVHGKKSILRMKTAFIDCAEAKFHFVVAICIVLS